MKPSTKPTTKIRSGIFLTLVFLIFEPGVLRAQVLKNIDYVTMDRGRVYVVANKKSTLLVRPLALTPELTLGTNGVIKITGNGEEKLDEGRRMSLDGFWIGADGMFFDFKQHYMIKDGALCLVKSGVLRKLDQEVKLGNGAILQTDGTLLTADQRMIRLQDGQKLAPNGSPIPARDYVMMVDGKLVLQKDGSIVPLPAGRTIGMSDGTKVTGDGLVTTPTGQEIALSDGQRLNLDGAAMPKF